MESEKEVSKEKGGLMTEEERETGSVKMQVYMTWAKAAGLFYNKLNIIYVN